MFGSVKGGMVLGVVSLWAGGALVQAQALKSVGTPIVSSTAPYGTGNKDIQVIRDGVYPDAATGSWQSSYDTYDGAGAIEAFFGYTFTEPYTFTGLIFCQGMTEIEGGQTAGTFASAPRVQVLVGADWTDVQGLQMSPAYTSSFLAFALDTFTFTPTSGTGIRIIGMEQEPETWVSCAELDVEGTPDGGTKTLSRTRTGAGVCPAIRVNGDRISWTGQSLAGRLQISDLSGRVVLATPASHGELYLAGLARGTYIARVAGQEMGNRRVFSW